MFRVPALGIVAPTSKNCFDAYTRCRAARASAPCRPRGPPFHPPPPSAPLLSASSLALRFTKAMSCSIGYVERAAGLNEPASSASASSRTTVRSRSGPSPILSATAGVEIKIVASVSASVSDTRDDALSRRRSSAGSEARSPANTESTCAHRSRLGTSTMT